MNELRFRAFDTYLNKMICDGFSIIGEVTVFSGLQIMIQETPIKEVSSLDRLLNLKIMQYIGVKDINGKDICNSDIVLINHPDDKTGDFTNAIGYVFYYDNETGFYHTNNNGRPPKRMWEYCKVVGNIYENPEILKYKKSQIKKL